MKLFMQSVQLFESVQSVKLFVQLVQISETSNAYTVYGVLVEFSTVKVSNSPFLDWSISKIAFQNLSA